MSTRIVLTTLALAALIHLLPLPGVLGGVSLTGLYGLPVLDNSTELLLRHRAIMFGLDAALLLWAIRSPALRAPAIALTLASDIAFLLLGLGGMPAGLARIAVFDGVSIIALLLAAGQLRAARRGSA